MRRETFRALYTRGLEITMFSGFVVIGLILCEWFFIDEALVIPTTFVWLLTFIIMWGIILILSLKEGRN